MYLLGAGLLQKGSFIDAVSEPLWNVTASFLPVDILIVMTGGIMAS
jgi:hypothetical protein